jgi:septal ring-binding cell division protein DamX
MSSTIQSVGTRTSERRNSPRQRVSFACIQLDHDNGGLVLDISELGLSLQTVAILASDDLGRMRFQLSPSQPWIDTRGRVVWLGGSLKTAGVEFIGLADEARNQIKQWISLELEANESTKQIAPKNTELSEDESANVIPFPQSETTEPVAEIQNRRPIADDTVEKPLGAEKVFQYSAVKSASPSFTGRARGTTAPSLSWPEVEARINRGINAREPAGFSKTSGRFIGLAVGTGLLLSALLFLIGYRLRKSMYVQQHVEAIPPAKTIEPSADNPANPTNPDVDATSPSDRPGFLLQVGAMRSRENADALADALERRNFPVFVSLPRGTGRFYRVVVGPYSDADSTLRAEEELRRAGFESIRTPWKPLTEQDPHSAGSRAR